jgi:hypothetical protein
MDISLIFRHLTERKGNIPFFSSVQVDVQHIIKGQVKLVYTRARLGE